MIDLALLHISKVRSTIIILLPFYFFDVFLYIMILRRFIGKQLSEKWNQIEIIMKNYIELIEK